MSMQKLSIIIPVFNEEKTVGLVIERLLAVPFTGWAVEIIAVNDGSSDGTRGVLDALSGKIRVIHCVKNGGKGSAVKAGIAAATGDFVIIQDADLECMPEEIPLLLAAMSVFPPEGKNIVMGSRELHKDNHKSLLLSRLGSHSITWCINFLYGSSLTDTLMCYKLFPRSAFGYFEGGGFEGEMLFLCKVLEDGYHITEVPVSYTPRSVQDGKKIQYSHGIKIIRKIIGFWVKNRLS